VRVSQKDARWPVVFGGPKFLAGSNAATYGIMPGSGLHLALTLLHRIGLSPREVLAAATSNYADVYGWRDVGRIEPGRVADPFLLDEDPRTNVSAVDDIHTLGFKGALVDGDALLTMSKTMKRLGRVRGGDRARVVPSSYWRSISEVLTARDTPSHGTPQPLKKR
jgi:hypothetical protein